jgi:hypothetical protein
VFIPVAPLSLSGGTLCIEALPAEPYSDSQLSR